jgi:hypothetical protein
MAAKLVHEDDIVYLQNMKTGQKSWVMIDGLWADIKMWGRNSTHLIAIFSCVYVDGKHIHKMCEWQ